VSVVFASSCSLLIRGNIAAVRQEIHLSGCSNFPSQLQPPSIVPLQLRAHANWRPTPGCCNAARTEHASLRQTHVAAITYAPTTMAYEGEM
jgi:hypothetical protein